MARFHSITWPEGSFAPGFACVLSFDSKKARAAYPAQCAQRIMNITHKQMLGYKREGYSHVLKLWDERQPLQFTTVA